MSGEASGAEAYLYVISCRLELAKIGVAGDARKRLRELQVGSPVELKLTLTRPYADRRGGRGGRRGAVPLLRRAARPRQLVSADRRGAAPDARQARHARGSRPRRRRRQGRRPRPPARSPPGRTGAGADGEAARLPAPPPTGASRKAEAGGEAARPGDDTATGRRYYTARRDRSQADRYDHNTVVRFGGQTAAEQRAVRQEQTRSREIARAKRKT